MNIMANLCFRPIIYEVGVSLIHQMYELDLFHKIEVYTY